MFLVHYVKERPWWPIQSPQNGRKKNEKDYEERNIGFSLLVLYLKYGKLWDSGWQEEGNKFHKLYALGMNGDLWDRVRGLSSETWKGCE